MILFNSSLIVAVTFFVAFSYFRHLKGTCIYYYKFEFASFFSSYGAHFPTPTRLQVFGHQTCTLLLCFLALQSFLSFEVGFFFNHAQFLFIPFLFHLKFLVLSLQTEGGVVGAFVVGVAVGEIVGDIVVGASVGSNVVGDAVGIAVGDIVVVASVGSNDGDAVDSKLVGLNVGYSVGDAVDSKMVGLNVGNSVGEAVCLAVGEMVGEVVEKLLLSRSLSKGMPETVYVNGGPSVLGLSNARFARNSFWQKIFASYGSSFVAILT